ncbi:hypothetical protein DesLBE_3872 [Desulfitobacterium sp. LBE]|uniref:Uncharacterized protein n=1 Tax=bioreactor metagenome TaxID=1076179 RepID=A0A644UBG5_9ZZZZ|nr:hypothetical protein [Desulfitobacterium hafniense]TWH59489.1 hypothetical protein DesLBE_3872 [Desulfitobacterium sp. LBE]
MMGGLPRPRLLNVLYADEPIVLKISNANDVEQVCTKFPEKLTYRSNPNVYIPGRYVTALAHWLICYTMIIAKKLNVQEDEQNYLGDRTINAEERSWSYGCFI